MVKMLSFVISLLAFVSVASFQVNDVCDKEYDLSFQVKGYQCQFMGSGVYVVEGAEVNFVRFTSMDSRSYIYVNTKINNIIIESGTIDQCNNILYGQGTVGKVIVNGELCEKEDKSTYWIVGFAVSVVGSLGFASWQIWKCLRRRQRIKRMKIKARRLAFSERRRLQKDMEMVEQSV